jgi:hypothetical protein
MYQYMISVCVCVSVCVSVCLCIPSAAAVPGVIVDVRGEARDVTKLNACSVMPGHCVYTLHM